MKVFSILVALVLFAAVGLIQNTASATDYWTFVALTGQEDENGVSLTVETYPKMDNHWFEIDVGFPVVQIESHSWTTCRFWGKDDPSKYIDVPGLTNMVTNVPMQVSGGICAQYVSPSGGIPGIPPK